jgi:hypothetical protein
MNLAPEHTVPLYSDTGSSSSARFINMLTESGKKNETVTINIDDAAYLVPIEVGKQSFLAVLDTGSADTWILSQDFTCKGCLGTGGTGYKRTESFVAIPDLKLDINYSSGVALQGIVGREMVSLGNITASNVTIAIAERGQWPRNRVSKSPISGVVGMAFPGDTRVFPKSVDVERLQTYANVPYDPVFTTMYKRGLVDPYFSIALNRPGERPGSLTLGGLPDLPIRYENEFTSAEFEYLIFEDGSYGRAGNNVKEYTLYMIQPQGFTVNGADAASHFLAIVDTDSPLNYLPGPMAAAVNRKFKPPAEKDRRTGQWTVDCGAVPPEFGLVINNTKLMIDPQDMKVKGGAQMLPQAGAGGKCLSTVQESNFALLVAGYNIIGSPMLKSYLSVFDVGMGEMRFSKRIR